MLALVEAGPAWRRPQISNLSIKSQRGSNFHWNHWKTQGKSTKINRWRNASNGANLGRCWRSDFLHTSNDFLMILVNDAVKMTSKIMKQINIIKEFKGKLNAWNFMIFVLDEPPKWHLERACFRLSTLCLKAQPELNYLLFRPPQNIKIIEKRRENTRKSNTWKS